MLKSLETPKKTFTLFLMVFVYVVVKFRQLLTQMLGELAVEILRNMLLTKENHAPIIALNLQQNAGSLRKQNIRLHVQKTLAMVNSQENLQEVTAHHDSPLQQDRKRKNVSFANPLTPDDGSVIGMVI
ncbi:MAG: hypothetical protein NTW08_03375 [Gammaproteobacteria bacterium]|nr:hypothetical protein [Gammaproteobacteria bacterium]